MGIAIEKNRITVGMLVLGLQQGLVHIQDAPDGNGTVCSINKRYFHFGGLEAADSTAENYMRRFSEEDIARELYIVLDECRQMPAKQENYKNCLIYLYNNLIKI